MRTGAPVYPLILPRGSRYERTFHLEDEDGVVISLAGREPKLQIRRDYENDTPVLTLPDDYEHGELYVEEAPDTHQLKLVFYGSGLDGFDSGVFDIRLEDLDGNFERLMQGTVFIDPDATR